MTPDEMKAKRPVNRERVDAHKDRMRADEMKSLIARIQMNADFYGRDSDVVRLADLDVRCPCCTGYGNILDAIATYQNGADHDD